jgi:hypothetical protein
MGANLILTSCSAVESAAGRGTRAIADELLNCDDSH